MTLARSDGANPSLVDKPPTMARRRVSGTLEDMMPIPDSPPLTPRRRKSCERSPVERQYSPASVMSDLTDDLSDFYSSNSEKRSSFTQQQWERGLSDISSHQSQELDAAKLQRWSGSSSLGDSPPQCAKKRSSRILLELLSDLFEHDDDAAPLQRWSGSSSLGDSPPQCAKKRSSRILLELLSDLFEHDDEHAKKSQA